MEIPAIVVWQVADTAKATFAVENYDNFVAVQSEAALRHVATIHPYDDTTGDGISLRGSTDGGAGNVRPYACCRRCRSGTCPGLLI